MGKKRANGEGHVYQKKNGDWEAMCTIGFNGKGKQRWKYFTGKTKQEASARMRKYQAEKERGDYIEPTTMSVEAFLDYWYNNHCISKVKDTTRADDESIIRNHLKPYFGKIRLCNLKGHQIQEAYKEMEDKGKVKGKKGGLSAKTIRNIHTVFSRVLNQACKEGLILRSPLDSITLPRVSKTSIEILSPEEQKALEQKCYDQPWGMAIILTLYSGMRLGEVLGLTWADINFDKNTLSINKQLSRLKNFGTDAETKTILGLRSETKTKSSTRVICIATAVMGKLKSYKGEQDAQKQKIKSAYNDLDMVFCTENGYYIDPKTFADFYTRTLKKADIGHKTFHALRHTFATRALETGIPPKVVSEILGHSSIQITLDTYSHVSPELQSNAMQKIADEFFVE